MGGKYKVRCKVKDSFLLREQANEAPSVCFGGYRHQMALTWEVTYIFQFYYFVDTFSYTWKGNYTSVWKCFNNWKEFDCKT